MDIASGSPRSRKPPSYAVFVLEGETGSSYSMVGRHKLVRMIREHRPEIVAVDNIHELASGRSDLLELIRRLPPKTLLVQVTGGERLESLAKVARWHGIIFDRLDPAQEAEACARLAARGVGHVLYAFEDRTWIKVSRRRSPGRGGWSQNRYHRKIHGSVKTVSREVEQQLHLAGLSYQSRAVEGFGGYIRCEFIVEAPRVAVPVRPGRREDAQIRVEGVESPRLQFRPMQQRRGYIIAGVDPGTTTGIAALNLQGELVDLTSSRTMSPSDVIEWLSQRGKPLIVATDVFPTPGAVEKIKRAFNAVLYSPGDCVAAEEKILLARPYGYKNDHERDALAAAVSAFKRYRNKFQQVERRAADMDPDLVKALVVKGKSIDVAISELSPQPPARIAQPQHSEIASQDDEGLRAENRLLSERVSNLRAFVDELQSMLASKEEEMAAHSRKMERIRDKAYREIKRDREIAIRDKEISRLRGLLRSERKYIKRLKAQRKRTEKAEAIEDMKGYRRLKPVIAFSKEAVLDAIQGLQIGQGDLILLEDARGGGQKAAEILAERGVDCIIVQGEMPSSVLEHLVDRGIPVFSSADVPVRQIDGIPFAHPLDIDRARALWLERMRERETQKKALWLEKMIDQYRVERKKEQKREERG